MAREIFLDTSKSDEISYWSGLGVIGGVTSNQLIMMKDGVRAVDLDRHVKEMCAVSPGTVSVELRSSKASVEEMVLEARRLSKLDPKVVVKVPVISGSIKTLEVLAELRRTQTPVNVTCMMTWEQMVMTAIATHDFPDSYISLFWARSIDGRNSRVNNLDDVLTAGDHQINAHPSGIVTAVRGFIDENGWRAPKIIIGSIRSIRQAGEALASGANIVTITPKVLRAMLTDDSTQKTVEEFDLAWAEMEKR